ncbi:hypothetical protein ACN20G_31855 (plasmid) [Streptomyces sp. BI20]|uniref:hypothetical protein n=1 Tax=Streptomyces sp. BI20 TaxID=3403460 RepID=UPI003C77AF04
MSPHLLMLTLLSVLLLPIAALLFAGRLPGPARGRPAAARRYGTGVLLCWCAAAVNAVTGAVGVSTTARMVATGVGAVFMAGSFTMMFLGARALGRENRRGRSA